MQSPVVFMVRRADGRALPAAATAIVEARGLAGLVVTIGISPAIRRPIATRATPVACRKLDPRAAVMVSVKTS